MSIYITLGTYSNEGAGGLLRVILIVEQLWKLFTAVLEPNY